MRLCHCFSVSVSVSVSLTLTHSLTLCLCLRLCLTCAAAQVLACQTFNATTRSFGPCQAFEQIANPDGDQLKNGCVSAAVRAACVFVSE